MQRMKLAFVLAVFTALATYTLITWGGIVHNTGSSLACPTWPWCFEDEIALIPDTSAMPPETQMGVFWEHGHRLLGSLVGLCCIGLVGLLWMPAPGGRSLRWPALCLLMMVMFQGALGAITVLMRISWIVSTIHLGFSMMVLLTMLWLARQAWLLSRTEPLTQVSATQASALNRANGLLKVTLAAVFIQILLGAMVRHTGSAGAAGLGPAACVLGIGEDAQPTLWPESGPAQLNMIHRYIAILIALKVLLCCARSWGWLGQIPASQRPAAWLLWAPAVLVGLQIIIGVGMVAMYLNPWMRTAHLSVPALLLANLWLLVMTTTPRPAQQSVPAGQPAPSAA